MEQQKLYDINEKLCYWLMPEICNTNVVNLQVADMYAKTFARQTKTTYESIRLTVITMRPYMGVARKFAGMAYLISYQKVETCPDGFVPMKNVIEFLHS